jgi:hypothetical protein
MQSTYIEIIKKLKKIEKIFGSMKFAVTIITIFTIFLIYGTFMESYHGAEFANRLVYKSWWFMGLQLLMFISIVVATYMRFPPKKRLYGFYTIHTGLITLFIGSFVTYINGIDGSLELYPNTPSSKIGIDNDFLKVTHIDEVETNKKFALPFVASPTSMNISMDIQSKHLLKIKEFYPSANLITRWEKSTLDSRDIDHGSSYTIFNSNVSQEFTMSLNAQSDFKSSKKLGLLNISYMPEVLHSCFVRPSKSGFLVWNTLTNDCYTPEQKNIAIIKTSKGNEFLAFKHNGAILKFFPNFSPLPVNEDLTKKMDSEFRVFSKAIFEKKPNLFLFGKKIAFYKKRTKKWIGKEFKHQNELIKLPWMSFQLRLMEHKDRMVPFQEPIYARPIQDNGKLISGEIKAVKVEVNNKDYWVRSDAPLALNNGKTEVRLQLTKGEIKLPYQVTLRRFKMDTNPGTKDPASYESFVDLLDGRDNQPAKDHHVFMNNPMKYDDFTFYQASYFQVSQEAYGSVFSVNFDPGRPLKYAGSLLLVLGSIWHYFIRRKKTKTKPNKATV